MVPDVKECLNVERVGNGERVQDEYIIIYVTWIIEEDDKTFIFYKSMCVVLCSFMLLRAWCVVEDDWRLLVVYLSLSPDKISVDKNSSFEKANICRVITPFFFIRIT